jgi:hypothetical protein
MDHDSESKEADSEVAKPQKPLKLRDLAPSNRCFWKDVYHDQKAMVVRDIRPLPSHEKAAMGMNEIAAEKRQGFFFHVPNFDALKLTQNARSVDPPNRFPPPPPYVSRAWK